MKTEKEVREYLKFMEEKVKGIRFENGNCLPDPYDKGWYDAARWMVGDYP